jgi:hypothetical protein
MIEVTLTGVLCRDPAVDPRQPAGVHAIWLSCGERMTLGHKTLRPRGCIRSEAGLSTLLQLKRPSQELCSSVLLMMTFFFVRAGASEFTLHRAEVRR